MSEEIYDPLAGGDMLPPSLPMTDLVSDAEAARWKTSLNLDGVLPDEDVLAVDNVDAWCFRLLTDRATRIEENEKLRALLREAQTALEKASKGLDFLTDRPNERIIGHGGVEHALAAKCEACDAYDAVLDALARSLPAHMKAKP